MEQKKDKELTQKLEKPMTRRQFLKLSGYSAAGLLLAGLPKKWAGPVYASDAP